MQNKDFTRTVAYVGVAGLLMLIAYVSQPSISRDNAAFDDSRQPFYENIKPEDAKALDIMVFDEKLGSMTPFRVQYKNNRWTIPSHNDYPADAEDRLKKTAGAILGLKKDSIVTDQKELHAELGVIDPLADEKTAKGWGTHVKLYGDGDKVLADFIVGKDVPNPNKTGFKYVRIPGQDRVYAVETKELDLSVRFADWIDTNLLETTAFELEKVTLKDYSVDLTRGTIQDRGTVVLDKDGQSSEWKVEGVKDKEETDKDKARELTTAVADMRIVGVREKPATLSVDLDLANRNDIQGMIERGFYPVEKGKKLTLVSDQGETLFTTKDGLQYTLRFGGFFSASRDDLTKGAKGEKAKKEDAAKDAKTKDEKAKDDAKDKKDDKAKDADSQDCRFLLVTVAFDESKFPPIPDPPAEKPSDKKPEAKPVDPKAKKADPKEAKAAEDAKKKAEEDEKKAKAEDLKRRRDERQKKIDDGKKRAKELTDRYARWYYVIPNDTFKKVRLTRKDLVKEKKDEKKEGTPAIPGFPPTTPPGNSVVPPPPKTDSKPAPVPATKSSAPTAAKPATTKAATPPVTKPAVEKKSVPPAATKKSQ